MNLQDCSISITEIDTPLGKMYAGAVDEGICFLEFADKKETKPEIYQGTNEHLILLKQQLEEYFEGKRKKFTIPLFVKGTEFQQSVWKTLRKIPYGSTISYKQQAEAMNKPKAVRAVANANGKNKIAIVIPCHRVIGTDGTLTGYNGGLWRKQFLLELEKNAKIKN